MFSILFLWVRALLVGSVLFVTLLAANMLQVCSLILLPISPSAFRLVNTSMAGAWWSSCVWVAETLYGFRFTFVGEAVPPHENAMVIGNHQGMADILGVLAFADRNRRTSDLKWFAKDPLKYVPGLGWGLYFLDCIFLKRDWTADRGKVRSAFSKLLEFRVPFYLVSFVEGTRATPDKIAASKEWSKSRGYPIFQHVLGPRTSGFSASIQGLRERLDAVYDLTILYPGSCPSVLQLMLGKCEGMELRVRRFPVGELPKEQEALSKWIWTLFEEKDRWLENRKLSTRDTRLRGKVL